MLPVEGHPRQAPATLWYTSGAPRGHPAPGPQSASRGDPTFHLLLATEAAEVPQGRRRTLRGLSRPISMVPCAKIRTNGVFGILLSQDLSKGGRHKSLCLRSSVGPMCVGPSWSSSAVCVGPSWSSSAIMCAFSPLAPRVHPPSRCQCGWKALSLSPFCDFLFSGATVALVLPSTPTVATGAVFTST